MATGGGESPTAKEDRCSICLQTLKEPTTLPCQHTFCKPCISQYISKENEPKQKGRKNLSCPVCRTDLTLHNDELSKLTSPEVNDMDKETRDKFYCVPCKNKGKDTCATNWCRDCQEKMCKNCKIEHDSFSFLRNHKVSSLEEIRDPNDIEYFGEYLDKCPTHPDYIAEAYCFDHEQLCCISCLANTHRKCENARAIRELVDKKQPEQAQNETFETDLSRIRTVTAALLQEKKEDKTKVEQSFLDIEESVNATVLKIKDSLDTLMISFRKELHLKQDEYESKTDLIIKEIEQLHEIVEKLLEKVDFVRKYGTQTHIFINLKKVKDENKKSVGDRIKPILDTQKLESQLILNDVVQQMGKLSSLGHVRMLEKEDPAIAIFRNSIKETAFKVVRFDSICVERAKIIEVGEDLRGGTWIDDSTLLVADRHSRRIIAVDAATGQQIVELTVGTSGAPPKRLSYMKETQLVYISSQFCLLQRVRYNNDNKKFTDLLTIKSSELCGGVCNDGKSFYTIVDKGIYKNDNIQNPIIRTNTQCDSCMLNGLAFDRMRKRFHYTSDKNEVVCVSEDGTEIFRYKDESMKTVSSVAVGQNGVIFAGDESGAIHLISEDGKQRRTMVAKCEKIASVHDVWTDKTFSTLFACGKKYIEVFKIE